MRIVIIGVSSQQAVAQIMLANGIPWIRNWSSLSAALNR
jgi:hypothetical protein